MCNSIESLVTIPGVSSTATCEKHPLSSTFPMLVPSLSWLKDHFWYRNGSKRAFSHRGEHTSHIRRELGRGVVGHGVEIVNVRQREICRLWDRQRLAALLLAGCGGERQDLLR